jgi:hypothetical protein
MLRLRSYTHVHLRLFISPDSFLILHPCTSNHKFCSAGFNTKHFVYLNEVVPGPQYRPIVRCMYQVVVYYMTMYIYDEGIVHMYF